MARWEQQLNRKKQEKEEEAKCSVKSKQNSHKSNEGSKDVWIFKNGLWSQKDRMLRFVLHHRKILWWMLFFCWYFIIYYEVYDGHGSSGKEASQAANDYIQTFLEKNPKRIKAL